MALDMFDVFDLTHRVINGRFACIALSTGF
jgi:hypothetical protein